MRQFLKGISVGVIGMVITIGGLAYGESMTRPIEVTFRPLRYIFDGEEKRPAADQQGFVYNGRTYVPLRFVVESLGKDVNWDDATSTITIRSIGFSGSSNPSPALSSEPTSLDNLPLIANGRAVRLDVPMVELNGTLYAPTAAVGEAIGPRGVSYDPATGILSFRRDGKELSLTPQGAKLNGSPFTAMGYLVNGPRIQVPIETVVKAFGGTVERKPDGVYITASGPITQLEQRYLLFVLPDGKRYVAKFSPGAVYTDGQTLYPSVRDMGHLLSVLNGEYRLGSSSLPTVSGEVETGGHYLNLETRYVDPTRINSSTYDVYTLSNPLAGKIVQYDVKGTQWQGAGAYYTCPVSMEDWFNKLGIINVEYEFDETTGSLTFYTSNSK